MHKLLLRQLQRVFDKNIEVDQFDKEWQTLLSDISNTYHEYEKEKRFVEHTLNLATEELYESYNDLAELNKDLENRVKKEVEKNREKDLLLMHQSRHAQMGEMISMIAHQWRQPLSTITAIAGNLKVQQELDMYNKSEFTERLKSIVEHSKHLSKTINDFRNYLKEDNEKVSVRLDDIIDETLSIFLSFSDSVRMEITKEYNCTKKVLIYPNELQQVILNLLNNAQDAIREMNISEPKLFIKSYYDNNCYIEICDNAGGIPKNIIDKIFDPYFTTKDSLNGSGLGLYMAKKILIEHCNAVINVRNSSEGACFVIEFKANSSD